MRLGLFAKLLEAPVIFTSDGELPPKTCSIGRFLDEESESHKRHRCRPTCGKTAHSLPKKLINHFINGSFTVVNTVHNAQWYFLSCLRILMIIAVAMLQL